MYQFMWSHNRHTFISRCSLKARLCTRDRMTSKMFNTNRGLHPHGKGRQWEQGAHKFGGNPSPLGHKRKDYLQSVDCMPVSVLTSFCIHCHVR